MIQHTTSMQKEKHPDPEFQDISHLAIDESIEEPSILVKIGLILSGIIAVLDAAALIAKIDLGKKIPIKWYGLWIIFTISAGTFFYLLNKRKPDVEQELPDTVDLSHMKFEEPQEEPPQLDISMEKTQTKMDERTNEVWDVISEFNPVSPSKDFTYQDQLFNKLKKTLLQKYMVTPEYKRNSRTKPDILVDRNIAIEAKDATPEVIETMYKRLSKLRVEYKKIIVVLFDRGRVPHSLIDRMMNESMTDLKELAAYKVIKV